MVATGRASGIKMVRMVEMDAPISLDGVAVHLDRWCVCLCYLHFAPENPEDGKMYLPITDDKDNQSIVFDGAVHVVVLSW